VLGGYIDLGEIIPNLRLEGVEGAFHCIILDLSGIGFHIDAKYRF
jgi:hypothetical protein